MFCAKLFNFSWFIAVLRRPPEFVIGTETEGTDLRLRVVNRALRRLVNLVRSLRTRIRIIIRRFACRLVATTRQASRLRRQVASDRTALRVFRGIRLRLRRLSEKLSAKTESA